ncbi:MAG: class I SAM-dependent methyltransferase [Deltaproteobacteria bacterium]|nr:class I SAM-dependent methyltransferase [Candidatus Zymogenaceae bacterium]
MAEVGVYRGDFAAAILERYDSIETYFMIDPWRYLDNWNKPANQTNDIFETFFSETKAKTDFAANKRIILRGTTSEVIEEIEDEGLDFAYIDSDHTLRGITMDLIQIFPKIRMGGWIGGDDFMRNVWQHDTDYEPTLVFPFTVYFAEAMDVPIYALPYNQFLIEKNCDKSFAFIDMTGLYGDTSLKNQLLPQLFFKRRVREKFPLLYSLIDIVLRIENKMSGFIKKTGEHMHK